MHRHPISVQEFRTPAYSVTLNDDISHSGATPVILGESIEMQSTARYYAGGGLPGAAMIGWTPPHRHRRRDRVGTQGEGSP